MRSRAPEVNLVNGTEDDDTAGLAGGEDDGAEPPCDECQRCHSERAHVSGGLRSWDDVPELLSLQDVESFPGVLVQTKGKHVADLDHIRAFYDLPDLPVRCSFKGAHRHGFGVVATMLCGETLRMGSTCGEKAIINFADVFSDLKRRRSFNDDRRAIETWPERYLKRLSTLRSPLNLRYRWLETLRFQLPELFAVLKSRRAQGAVGTEVTMPAAPSRTDLPEELRGGATAEIRRSLRGLALLENNLPDLAKLESKLSQFRTEMNAAPAVDGPTARALAQIASRADASASRAEQWLRETEDFIVADNLRLALVALGADNASVEPGNGGMRVSYMGATAVFSFG